jgi:hypothetical protein
MVEIIVVRLEGRNTNMGAYTKYTVYGQDGKEIYPTLVEYSKSHHHWEDVYHLPANTCYIVTVKDITNSGKHKCRVEQMIVSDKNWGFTPVEKIPPYIQPPCRCLTAKGC